MTQLRTVVGAREFSPSQTQPSTRSKMTGRKLIRSVRLFLRRLTTFTTSRATISLRRWWSARRGILAWKRCPHSGRSKSSSQLYNRFSRVTWYSTSQLTCSLNHPLAWQASQHSQRVWRSMTARRRRVTKSVIGRQALLSLSLRVSISWQRKASCPLNYHSFRWSQRPRQPF